LSLIFDMAKARDDGLAAAVAALRAGQLVAMPTETVYGLAADATNAAAVAGIFLAKGRPRFNPLIVHIATLADAERLAVFNPTALRLAEEFWPGPLTLVLPRRLESDIADLVTAGLDTIALRVPAHPVAEALLGAFARPLAAPSANLSGRVSATTAAHVAADFGTRVAVILDAGPTRIGLESTIVGLARPEPLLLRAGGIAAGEIEAALGRELTRPAHDPSKPQAPGMLPSHYAPRAVLRLDAKELRPGEALLAFGPDLPLGANLAVAMRNLSPTGDVTEAAANFFAALRELDGLAARIAVMPIPEEGLGEAINDRLRRAAAPRDAAPA
jgi:L-threonylcarbamoyladenylate synthase